MNKKSQKMIEKINTKLLEHNQKTKVIEWHPTYIILEDSSKLTNNDRIKFIRRIFNTKTTMWVDNIDNILNGSVTEKQIRSTLSSIGGVAVQRQHGQTIKHNLNTGTPWNKGMKNNYTIGPMPAQVKDKIGKSNSGIKNGMFGVNMSDEQKKERSLMMKRLILAGKFTPNSNNRNTHWSVEFDGKKYRSSWEALYQYINPTAQYEIFRIEYYLNETAKIYIVDFIDTEHKLLIEVKPKELCSGDKFNAKMIAVNNWASIHNYTVLIVDKEWLQAQQLHIDYSRFDLQTSQKIRKLYEINKKNRD